MTPFFDAGVSKTGQRGHKGVIRSQGVPAVVTGNGLWAATIYGEPASKANQRQLVHFGGRPALIKSKKARGYAADVVRQVCKLDPLLDGPLSFTATIYYASHRPDLDASVLLDALQGLVYANDRQVRELHLFHAIDKANPRAEVRIERLP